MMRFLILSLNLFLISCSSSLEERDFYVLDKKINKAIQYKTPIKADGNFKKVGELGLFEPLDNPQHSLYCVTPETYTYFRREASKYECKLKP